MSKKLSFKPDLAEARKRWQAFFNEDIIDRPIVKVTAPLNDSASTYQRNYYEMAFGDIDEILDKVIQTAAATYYGGEAIPSFMPSIGPDEIATFCGSELCWKENSKNTNWSKPFVKNWEDVLPLQLNHNNQYWQRSLELFRRSAEKLKGKMLISPLDLHTNMDLLAAIRGSERLCEDLIDQPKMIDKAMESARTIFSELWQAISEAGQMKETGYYHAIYGREGAAVLQCDFSCMISPEMFRRWVLPALEEEAKIVDHAFYHWDGPDALVHTEDLLASKGLFVFGYVPGAGNGSHYDHLELLQKVQKGGKAVQARGTVEEIKAMHKKLDPTKVIYETHVGSKSEAEKLLDWFETNT